MRAAIVLAQRIAGMVGSEHNGMAVTFDALKAPTRLRKEADFDEKQATTSADDWNTDWLINEIRKLERRLTRRLGTIMAVGFAIVLACKLSCKLL